MGVIFSGRAAVVTGGASGIGEACVRRLAREGAAVAIIDLQRNRAEALVEALRAEGRRVESFVADVARQSEVAAAVSSAAAAFGRLDVAINSAGIGGDNALLEEGSFAFWERTIAINLSGVYYAMRAEFEAMRRSGGAIVNIASILGEVAYPDAAPYVAAKHGVIGLTKCAALSWGAQDIRVTAVCPTFVRTPLNDTLPEEAWPPIMEKHPLGRLPSAEDVAALACFLASDDAANITGSSHLIDGGYVAS